jgi:hypothetical protein
MLAVPRASKIRLRMATTPTVPPAPDPAPAPGDGAPAPEAGQARPHRRHRGLVNTLIVITALLSLVGMLSVFANRLLFNPDNWENTSTQLLQNQAIRTQTAEYLVGQLYSNVNVADLLKEGLPKQFQGLAGPAAGALQNVAVQGAELLLSRPEIQTLWAKANRAADQAFITIANGGKGAVAIDHGVVTLDLASIIGQVATNLGLPSSITSKLPANVAHLTVLKSDQLGYVQSGGKAIKGLALWLTILVPLLYALAIFLAVGWRRNALMRVGFAIVFAGLLGVAARHILESQISNALTNDQSLRAAIGATISIATQILGQLAGAFILVGAVIVAAGWFAGPARLATAARRSMAPFMRRHPGETFAVAAGIMVLVFIWDPIPATGHLLGIIIFFALAMLGTEVLRRQTGVEFPNAQPGDTSAAIRARWAHWRAGREEHKVSHSSRGTDSQGNITTELSRLAELKDKGDITPAEYDAAKARLLHA